jgi:hypothetical protein
MWAQGRKPSGKKEDSSTENAKQRSLRQQTDGVAGYIVIDKSTSEVDLRSMRFFRCPK